jgi:hypothetical protein
MSFVRNPALLLACGLPLVAVAASFATLSITLANPEGQLPEQYHWEGFQLDRDFSRGERARELRVDAVLSGLERGGQCQLTLRFDGTPAPSLVLRVAHATLPSLDQQLTLRRAEQSAEGTVYTGECRAAQPGHWRFELADAVNGWALRTSARGVPVSVALTASSADGD